MRRGYGKRRAVYGQYDVVRRLHQIKTNKPEALRRGMIKAAFYTLRESNKITPIDTGALRLSGYVRDDSVKTGKYKTINISVVYNVEYAAAVHNRLDLYHEPPTQAMFLEDTMTNKSSQINKIIVDEVIKG